MFSYHASLHPGIPHSLEHSWKSWQNPIENVDMLKVGPDFFRKVFQIANGICKQQKTIIIYRWYFKFLGVSFVSEVKRN